MLLLMPCHFLAGTDWKADVSTWVLCPRRLHKGSLVVPFKQQDITSDHISVTLADSLFPCILHFCVLISCLGFVG